MQLLPEAAKAEELRHEVLPVAIREKEVLILPKEQILPAERGSIIFILYICNR
jgi:hypothetical protein